MQNAINSDHKLRQLRFTDILSHIFSFEMVILLFLFAGRYKADPRFSWVPVDLTLFFAILSLIVFIYILWQRFFIERQRNIIPPKASALAWMVFVFTLYITASLLWTSGKVYAVDKVSRFATLTVWGIYASACIVSYDRKRLNRFLVLLVIFSFWISIESLFGYTTASRFSDITILGVESNYQGPGQVLGASVIVLLVYLLFFAKKFLNRLVIFIVLSFYLFLLLALGGRGALMSVIAAAIFIPIIPWSDKSKPRQRSRYLIAYVTVILLFLFLANFLSSTGFSLFTIERFADIQGNLRWLLYSKSLTYWMEAPIWGHGVGSFPLLFGHYDTRLYPHNLILELLVESGLVGFGIFVSLVIMAIIFLYRSGGRSFVVYQSLIMLLFIKTLADSMISGDINSTRFMFFVLGLMVFDKSPSFTAREEKIADGSI